MYVCVCVCSFIQPSARTRTCRERGKEVSQCSVLAEPSSQKSALIYARSFASLIDVSEYFCVHPICSPLSSFLMTTLAGTTGIYGVTVPKTDLRLAQAKTP